MPQGMVAERIEIIEHTTEIGKSTGSDTWRIEMKYSFSGPQLLRTLLLSLLDQ